MSETLTVCQNCQKLNKVPLAKLKSEGKAVCGHCGEQLKLKAAVTEVDERDLWRIVRKSDKPVLVDFWASWCGPCKMYGPVFEEASMELDSAVFLKVNTETNPHLSQSLGIRGIPTTIVFKNGQEVTRQSGALDRSALQQLST